MGVAALSVLKWGKLLIAVDAAELRKAGLSCCTRTVSLARQTHPIGDGGTTPMDDEGGSVLADASTRAGHDQPGAGRADPLEFRSLRVDRSRQRISPRGPRCAARFVHRSLRVRAREAARRTSGVEVKIHDLKLAPARAQAVSASQPIR